MKKLATPDNFGKLVGALIIAYAIYGCFSDEILVLRSKWEAGGPKYVHGALVYLAALGYLSLAIAAILMPAAAEAWMKVAPGDRLSRPIPSALWFLAIGIVVLGSLGISVR